MEFSTNGFTTHQLLAVKHWFQFQIHVIKNSVIFPMFCCLNPQNLDMNSANTYLHNIYIYITHNFYSFLGISKCPSTIFNPILCCLIHLYITRINSTSITPWMTWTPQSLDGRNTATPEKTKVDPRFSNKTMFHKSHNSHIVLRKSVTFKSFQIP